jgi:alpha-L-rhamnosidase/Glycosyl hydrolases family 2, sugar binding domain
MAGAALAGTVVSAAQSSAAPAAGAAAGAGASGGAAPPLAGYYAQLNPVTKLTGSSFASPPQNNMPWARWNFPPATVTTAGLQADILDAYQHNIGGLEIGQGGVPTADQLTAIYTYANKLGIKISLKAANGLPGTTYAATDNYARRTLAVSRQTVDAGASVSGAVPGTGTIVAVLAYQCTTAPCAATGTVELDRSSVKDLTSTLTGTDTAGYNGGSTAGNLAWTAPGSPAGAQWVVLTFRAVPFGDEPETLSPQGTTEYTTAYDTYFAGGLGTLVRQNGGDFFVDSHASDPWGAPEELWASDMRTQFKARAGYDIVPDLAALIDPTMAGASLGGGTPTGTFYSFSDGSAARVRSDFNKVRTDMYTQYRLTAFENWAHTYNMRLRLQQEDGPITSIGDQLETSAALDQSEYESLTGSDQTDIYRPMASANHMTGNTWYSTECCAVLNESYAETFQDQIIRMNHEFAGGVNRIVYHIRPYIDTPATTWPGLGFSATAKVSFANANNRTEPNYVADEAALNDYFARMNEVLTQGAAKTDVAVYMRDYSSPAAFATSDPSNKHWQDPGLQRAGYTWDYLDESLFSLPNAVVTGKRLAQAGPDYKALVFDASLYPTSNTARGTMTLEAAKDFLSYAKAGLPIVFVGTPAGTGSMPQSQDATLGGIVSQILAMPNVHQVASESAVPGLLASLGIQPAAKPAAPTSLLSVRRDDPATATTYYYLYNEGVDAYPGNTGVYGDNPSNLYEEPSACRVTAGVNNPCMATGSAVDTTVALEGSGVPYTLDAFSGQVTPISQYTRSGNTVTVRVSLARDASTVIALTGNSGQFGVKPAGASVTSTTAQSAAQVGSSVVVRDTQAGTYVTKLSGGGTVKSVIPAVPAAIDLTGAAWQLNAEDWQPANPYGTAGPAGTLTTKVPVSVSLTGLKAWPDIPQLANASGIGTYTTTFQLPASWNARDGAALSLGQVTDSFTVAVNGHAVPVDQVSAAGDISQYLKPGANQLTVRVATTLNNRLFALDASVAKRGLIQNYGLIGPVTVTPYGQAVVWNGGGDDSQ